MGGAVFQLNFIYKNWQLEKKKNNQKKPAAILRQPLLKGIFLPGIPDSLLDF